jgi:hypothetical protein
LGRSRPVLDTGSVDGAAGIGFNPDGQVVGLLKAGKPFGDVE